MRVTTIQRVNSLSRAVSYITRMDKTKSNLLSSFNCSPTTILRDFKNVLNEYNYSKDKERELKPRMIVQSFSPDENITPEQAHKYGKEFVKNYLQDGYQYILATHHDTDHIHNHIVFNDINYKTLSIFDSSRENTLHRMRNENDLVAEKHGLNIIEQTRQKHKYLSNKDYVSRSKGISFKEKIEKDIDLSIMDNNTFNDFLKSMEYKGYEIQQGKYLAFKSPDGKKFMRTKTLGFNYLENSIKYRINNKDYIPFKPKVTKREWIDKNQQRFKNNKGLQRWATYQNINYLHEVNNILSKENITLEQFAANKQAKENFNTNLEKKLSKIDNQMFKLKKMSDCYDIYKESYNLMIGFKKLDTQGEKEQYKKVHYQEFKKYDMAKKNMSILKKGYNINNSNQLKKKLYALAEERKLIYDSVNLNREKENYIEMEQKQQQKQQQQQERKKQRNKEMEL